MTFWHGKEREKRDVKRWKVKLDEKMDNKTGKVEYLFFFIFELRSSGWIKNIYIRIQEITRRV